MNDAMLDDLRVNWGWIALRGAVAILFGILALESEPVDPRL